jgi:hypothetical protein
LPRISIRDRSSADNWAQANSSKINPFRDLPLEIGMTKKLSSELFPIFDSVREDRFESGIIEAKTELKRSLFESSRKGLFEYISVEVLCESRVKMMALESLYSQSKSVSKAFSNSFALGR